MKCPYCGKENNDDAKFCGFCGKQVPQMPLEGAVLSPLSEGVKTDIPDKTDSVPAEKIEETKNKKTKNKTGKKQTALKALAILVLFSFISGSVLGGLTARGVISIKSLIPNSDFKWTSFLEGQTEKRETEDAFEDKESEKGETSETDFPTDGEVETGSSMETRSQQSN